MNLRSRFPGARGACNDPTDLAQRTQIQPVVPAHIEGAVNAGNARRQQLGISDGLLRISVGIEDSKDIVNDIEQALEA